MSLDNDFSGVDSVSFGSINLDEPSVRSINQLEEAIRQSVLTVLSSPEQMAALSREERQRVEQQARQLWPNGAPELDGIYAYEESGSDATDENVDSEITQDVNLVRTMQMLYEELGSAMLTDMPSFALFDLIRSIARLVQATNSQTHSEDEEWAATVGLLDCSSAGNLLHRLDNWPTCNERFMTCTALSDFDPLFQDSIRHLKERTGGEKLKVVGEYRLGQCDICCSSTDTLLWGRGCCQTSVCVACLHRWLTDRLLEVHTKLACPGCETVLTLVELRHLLSETDVSRREKLLARHHGNNKGEKDCPRCSCMAQRPKKQNVGTRLGRSRKAKRAQGGVVVKCQQCDYPWCFDCHSPVHPGISCRQFRSGAQQLESWAKQMDTSGQRKARRCTRCKAMIEKSSGCNHMECANCNFQFCYKCGDRWDVRHVHVPFIGWSVFGGHSSHLSVFGCKENFMANRPALRRLIRGTLFVLRACGLVLLPTIAVAILLPIAAALVALAIPLSPLLIPVLVYYVRKRRNRRRS